LDEDVLAAFGAWEATAVAWIVDYWVRRLGRRPDTDEIEPATRIWWEQGSTVTGSQYLLAIGKLQHYSRTVASFFADIDVWLTPTLAEPPVPIGEINGTTQDPAVIAERMVSFIGYPAWVANVTGNPAVSVPLHWSGQGLPIGVHFLGRFGDEATLIRLAAQLEQARPWSGRLPSDPTTASKIDKRTARGY
jgi:amidase